MGLKQKIVKVEKIKNTRFTVTTIKIEFTHSK